MKERHCKSFLFLQFRPNRAIAAAGNRVMPSWFDVPDFTPGGEEHAESIERATVEIHALIDSEVWILYFFAFQSPLD
jgi:hypothetical protein